MPPREIAYLRERVRRRAFLVRQRAKLKTKIKSSLTIEGINPPTGHGLYTKKGEEGLKSLGLEPVDCYLRLITPLNKEILYLSRELRAMARDDPDIQPLMTIPGVGYYIGLLIKAETGDVSRFSSGNHLASYAGLVPSTKISGGVTHHGRITKEGSSWLRWAVVEAVHSHLRYDTPVTRLYHRVAERRGSPTAKVAMARKLVTVCYSVLKNMKTYYNPLHSIMLRQ